MKLCLSLSEGSTNLLASVFALKVKVQGQISQKSQLLAGSRVTHQFLMRIVIRHLELRPLIHAPEIGTTRLLTSLTAFGLRRQTTTLEVVCIGTKNWRWKLASNLGL